MQMWTAGSVIRTQWCPMGTGTAGTVPTVTSIMASRRWVSKVEVFAYPYTFFLDASAVGFKSLYQSCVDLSCFQNGDYNKPIPAQYMEHLNHGVSGGLPSSETPKTLQFVNCQMLLCRKCNTNQSVKIKQLASFIPRDDVSTVLLSFHYDTIFIATMTYNTKHEMYHCLFCRRTTMRKLRLTSTTLSRPISYAGHVRQLWSTTSNIKTGNFEQCF